MKRAAITLVVCALLACAAPKAGTLKAEPSGAKVTQADAQATALKRVPGGIVKESELETERGKLLWSFDIATPGTDEITEVQVDAITGEILSVEKETVAQQQAEKRDP